MRMNDESPRPAKGTAIRAVTLLLFGGWIAFSPAYRQVFDGRSTWFPRWVMFHGFGRDVCDVRFFEGAGTMLTPLDRFEVLGRERSWSTSKSLVRMGDPVAVDRVTRKICKALGAEADVRVYARCGSRGEWKVKRRPKSNACPSVRNPSPRPWEK